MTDQYYILHAFVSGKVQGVWFRQSTRQVADRLGITGFAKNLPDGRVEVKAWGSQTALEQLSGHLETGPELARVDSVEKHVISASSDKPAHFETL